MEKIVALVSDYGLKDHYVGTVHAVIKDVDPEIQIVDITHNVRPFDIVDGAVKLKWSYKYFPLGTVFLALVDPDSSAEPIIVSTERYFVVCPNNGIVSLMAEEEPVESVYLITADHYFLEGKGNFRGRNQFAPIAAELSRLQNPSHFGEKIEKNRLRLFKLPPNVRVSDNVVETIVLDIDSFGNLILNLSVDEAVKSVEINDRKVEKFLNSFSEAQKGELFISVNPEGYLQIVAYMANAAALLGVKRGQKVRVEF